MREKEKNIQKDQYDGININNYTLNEMFKVWIKQKANLAQSSIDTYTFDYNKNVRYIIGNRILSSIKYSEIVGFYVLLKEKHKLSYRTISRINTILKAIFDMAIRDNLIRSNPTYGAMESIVSKKESVSKKIKALTKEEESIFFNYVANSEAYKNGCQYSQFYMVPVAESVKF